GSGLDGLTGVETWVLPICLRFDLDCAGGGFPCPDQGPVVSYGGDSTITADCPGVSWTTNVPGGGSGTNEIVFTPTSPIVIMGGELGRASCRAGVELGEENV